MLHSMVSIFWISILTCNDGDILFGGVNGLNSLNPESVGRNELIPEKFDPGKVQFDDPYKRWKNAFLKG